MLTPIELARINDYTTNGGSVAANPFGGGVDNDIGSVVDRSNEVTASAKCVVDLGEEEAVS